MTSPAGSTTTSSGRTYRVQGTDYPSVSTVTKTLHAEGLAIWRQKRIAYAVAHDPLIRQLAANEDTLYKATRQALDTAPTLAADLGTEVHRVTEEWDKGNGDKCQDDIIRRHLDRWREARDDYGIVPVSIERTVVNRDHGYAGTYDRIVTLNHGLWRCSPECDNPNHTADIKSGADVWPDTAIQMAAYTYAPEVWDPATDLLEPRIPACTLTGIVFSVHEDAVKVVPMSLPPAWEALVAALRAFEWEQVKKAVIGKPLRSFANDLPW